MIDKELTMTDCKKVDCPFDPVEWGKLIERQDDHAKQLSRIEEKIDKVLGNGLIKRIRRVEYTVWTFIGGITVLAFLIKELHLLG